ncbi:MAG: substrate-binding domain-containing protein [Succinivibrio sp.]|nr:substrate-binding domain-containing protein [Succinivibrio sp.]
MATIRDVARLANVSVATVSRVLNGTAKVSDEAKNAVLEATHALGFYLNANARALAQKDSEIIGVLVSEVSDPYFGVMVRSCEEVAHSNEKILLVAQGFHEEKRELRAINSLLSHRCAGLVVHALAVPDKVMAEYMKSFPYMVMINRVLPGFEDRCVNINNFRGMYLTTKTLIENGHRKIAYVNSSHRILDADERCNGYRQALLDHGCEVNENLILKVSPSLEGGTTAAHKLLEHKDEFTAVACYNDALAAALMAVFADKGIKVPEQISVIGFDNLFLSSCLNPPLTTVTNPVDIMGKYATLLSLALYNHQEFKLPEFETKLIWRKSVRDLEK